MNDKIKSAVEIAMEKAAKLDDLSEEEKRKINNKKKLEPIMADFYRNKIKADKLWKKFKDKDLSLLKLAQLNIVDSLKFGLNTEELKRRSGALIALESLKKEQNTSLIQNELNELELLNKKALDEKKQIYNQFKTRIENDPKARTKVINQGSAKIMMKLSVEQAIAQNQQWKKYLLDFDNRYGSEFGSILDKIKQYIS